MRVYNTLTRKKEELVPLNKGEMKIYVCGPTVYNFFHIGNARPFVVFDTLRRYLEYRGTHVTFVQNFTDVDDKITGRSPAGESAKSISANISRMLPLNVNRRMLSQSHGEYGDIIKFVAELIEKDLLMKWVETFTQRKIV
jgi:cysteinyl-tRNA synthetase